MLESKLTTKSQTTLPAGVRDALGIVPGDWLSYEIEHDFAIIRRKAPPIAALADDGDDPAITAFLNFIERDLCRHPEQLRELPQGMIDRARELVAGIEVDLDAPIDGDVAI
jgi:antitoxin PrlF